jgi:hypothetical protein
MPFRKVEDLAGGQVCVFEAKSPKRTEVKEASMEMDAEIIFLKPLPGWEL